METATNRAGAGSFEVEGAGSEFHNPLSSTTQQQQQQQQQQQLSVDIRTTAVDTSDSPSQGPSDTPSSVRTPGGSLLRRAFRLTVTTDDPVLQPYFPNGPRKFPEGADVSAHVYLLHSICIVSLCARVSELHICWPEQARDVVR